MLLFCLERGEELESSVPESLKLSLEVALLLLLLAASKDRGLLPLMDWLLLLWVGVLLLLRILLLLDCGKVGLVSAWIGDSLRDEKPPTEPSE